MIGQINLGTPAGECLRSVASKDSVKVIVEVGTWNGAGSTKCLFSGMRESDTLHSLECSRHMFEQALPLWDTKDNVILIYGKLIEESEMDVDNLSSEEQQWYYQDIVAMRECPNVFDKLPSSIDFLVLDGGEFSTLSEFMKLYSRSNYIFLDDTKCRKNKKTRELLLKNKDFEVLEDHQEDRNGWSLFARRAN